MTPTISAPPGNDRPLSRPARRNRLAATLAMVLGVAAVPAGLVWIAGPAAAASLVVEAETFTSVDGYGATKQADSTASAGYRLMVDSAVTVTKTVSTTTASTGIVVRARTDSVDPPPGANMTVTIDGTDYAKTVDSESWKDFTITRSVAAGSHTVRIYFANPEERNLYLDNVTFTQGTQTTPTPTTSTGVQEHAYLTGYSVEDNTPPGSRDISNPVIHQRAGGTGTYADPITLAVGHSITNGRDVLDFAAGTRFYLPVLRVYVVVEDTCGDGSTPQNGPCHTGYPNPSTNRYWLDVFVGSDPNDDCMDSFSSDSGWTVIRNPDAGWRVDSRPNELGAECTLYSNTPVRA